MGSPKMNKEILTAEVQFYLQTKAKEQPNAIALKKSPFDGVSSAELATQIESRQKAEKKLPLWFNTPQIYYPRSISMEQASSEDTARYKASLVEQGDSVIDLTGGIGVDSYYFSLQAKQVLHCEVNQDLCAIAQHNATVLGAKNMDFIADDGLQVLENLKAGIFQIIYLDPSRRVNTRKVFMLSDCEPNILALQSQILEKAPKIILKTAPILDISLTLNDLHFVKEVHILSIRNECKELLFCLENGYSQPPIVHVSGLTKDASFRFSFFQEEEKNALAQFGLPQSFLYDPDVALLKAGCFKLISQRFQLDKLHLHTHLYTSDHLLPNFPGRSIEIIKTYPYQVFKKEKRTWNANVVTRNFPLNVEDIRKKHKIAESKDTFLYFYKGIDESLLVTHGERLT